MEQYKIDRINELSKLARQRTLTEDELAERATLRAEYLSAICISLESQLDNTYIVDEKGNKRKVRRTDK